MSAKKNTTSENNFWTQRYQENKTGWDIGYPSTPLKTYIDQLKNKDLTILIPGAGNAYEAEYLFMEGFNNVFILDISEVPLKGFQKRLPHFPKNQLIQGGFFELEGQYDLILEQTFFCSFLPTKENRSLYGKKMAQLLKPTGKLVGLWFDFPLIADVIKRPFGGSREEYLTYLSPYFETVLLEECHNSIKPRMGSELFGIFKKK